MTNDNWQSVRISKDGWELVDETPLPLFSRYTQTPQAEPDRNYEPDIFDRFLSLTNLKTDEDRILLSVYIMTLFIPDIPHVISQSTRRERKCQVNPSNTDKITNRILENPNY